MTERPGSSLKPADFDAARASVVDLKVTVVSDTGRALSRHNVMRTC